MGGLQKIRKWTEPLPVAPCMFKSELTVYMLICKEGASCCPLVQDTYSYIQRTRARARDKKQRRRISLENKMKIL